MRIGGQNNDLRVLAVAGTNVVLIGWTMPEEVIRGRGVLGFSIQRTRHADGEVIWLAGFKTFQGVDDEPDPGVPISSFRHPIQSFQWSDYSVSPNMTYDYRVVARTGAPGALALDDEVTLTVTTETIDQGAHAVFFNRGAIASQEYARRFQNLPPDVIGQPAFDWLSRGLVEGLEAFIAQAGKGDELYGAFFEFKSERIYAALRAARKNKAKFRIIYDGKSQKDGNEAALDGSGIESHVFAREHPGSFAHNKFLVLCRDGAPIEVWTGSTNLSNNGMFGHSNNAHVVRSPAIAKSYFDYWAVLKQDLTRKPTRQAVDTMVEVPPVNVEGDTAVVFSPRSDYAALDWYAQLAGAADAALFATFAFGMDDRFVSLYGRKDDVLRFALMEKKGNGKSYKAQAKQIDRVRRRPNTVVAVGNYIAINAFDRWLKEIDRLQETVNVRFVHTKYLLVDPLGPHPAVVVGSANFSEASSDTNDENMLVIRDNPAVADIYLGEFMRLFSHYAFRESLTFKKLDDNELSVEALRQKHLLPDTSWIDQRYFKPGTDRALRRVYFSGG